MLSVLTKYTHTQKHKNILEVKYVLYLDCGDGLRGISVYIKKYTLCI